MRIITLPQKAAVLVVQLYRMVVSPLLPQACRFQPSCSRYAVEAITRYGLLRGGWMSVKRILRCNPFFPGGFDPVP